MLLGPCGTSYDEVRYNHIEVNGWRRMENRDSHEDVGVQDDFVFTNGD